MSEPPALVKAVLDTNVLLRGLTSARGASGRIVDALMGEVLRRPKVEKYAHFSDVDIEMNIRALRRVAEMVSGAYVVKMVRSDPKDDHIVATALEGGAAYIVTQDRRDLLPLKVTLVKGFGPIQLETARDFLRILGNP